MSELDLIETIKNNNNFFFFLDSRVFDAVAAEKQQFKLTSQYSHRGVLIEGSDHELFVLRVQVVDLSPTQGNLGSFPCWDVAVNDLIPM